MRKFIFGTLLIGLLSNAFGQVDRVFLTNGSLVKGIILNDSLGDTLQLEVYKSIVSIPYDAIDEIYPHRLSNQELKYKRTSPIRSLSTNITLGIVSGKTDKDKAAEIMPSASLMEMYHLHPLANFGVKIGVVNYPDYYIFPISLEYQSLFGRSYRSWMTYGNIGYSLTKTQEDLTDQYEFNGGLNYQFGMGWHAAQQNFAFQFRLGYSVQNVEQIQIITSDYSIIQKRKLNRITAQIVYQIQYR
ncbi:MAG: hypothetical protein CMB80_10540 [Flammeovirgaceae bacterium]|nr:hypothetical protein [Flammeovirgaceae bacterium]HCX22802.1 hypothetical protein [Cytophagales bacterium]|tara:strand:+ start:2057 stop:2788 length:732 start_codon:yes stop_codon:yes gene_type:complete